MNILPTNDLLFKKGFTTQGKEYLLKAFVEKRTMVDKITKSEAIRMAEIFTVTIEGKREGMEEAIRRLHTSGFSIEQIVDIMKYELEFVKKALRG